MASSVWEIVGSVWCDRVEQNVSLLEERIYPGELQPSVGAPFQVRGRKCTLGLECNLVGFSCCWAYTNPNYNPFVEQ